MTKDKEDSPSRSIKQEIIGVLLSAVTILLALALFTHHPEDPSFSAPDTGGRPVQNWIGRAGSFMSSFLFESLGLASFWLVFILGHMTFFSFQRQNRPASPSWVALGYLLVILASSAMLSGFRENFQFFGWNFPWGGVVGLVVYQRIAQLLNPPGTNILLLVLGLIGLILLSRVSLAQVGERIKLSVQLKSKEWRDDFQKNRERRRKAKVLSAEKEQQKEREAKPPVIVTNPTVVKPPPAPKVVIQQEQFLFMKDLGDFNLPPLSLLDDVEKKDLQIQQQSLIMNSRLLEKKLKDFGVEGQVTEVSPGPVITMYEFEPAPGVKISRITGLADDLAMAMRAVSIRIVAPLPGKAVIGIEIPNSQRETVGLKEILAAQDFAAARSKLTIALGKDIMGAPVVANLARMPHLMIAGATGTGKSVSLNAMICSILFKARPEEVRFLMIDPKRIELLPYEGIPHLLHEVVTEPKMATRVLRWAIREMEDRYTKMAEKGSRGVDTYNQKLLKENKGKADEYPEGWLPYIVIIIDELADLMMVSSRDVEEYLTRLAQMARAAGIHLLIATQRPSVDVLTGIIKANFPTRISFQVSSKTDSRTILDTNGAEALLGAGDMLYLPPGVSKLQRIHGAYVSEAEIKRVTQYLRDQKEPVYDESIMTMEEPTSSEEDGELDEKYDEAVRIVTETRQVSISMIQRKLRIGYNRAARLVEIMEREGIVGSADGGR
ncbi:MAG: DNA translocase FtsK 4TM domain-containing protein, partial [Desulfobacterota bacterium]|nr:DNA translocase FtsK 4TM domain-containing protein [Thermodesulfobacteriota bacterium]